MPPVRNRSRVAAIEEHGDADVEVIDRIDTDHEYADNNDTYQGKYYVFTINNPSLAQLGITSYENLHQAISKRGHEVRYAIWSLEIGNSGTPHIQGYMQLKEKVRVSRLKGQLATKRFWVAPAKGLPNHNNEYISHTGKHAGKAGLLDGPWTHGTCALVTQGARSDLETVAERIKTGASLKDLAREHTSTFIKYSGGISKAIELCDDRKRTWTTELYIYWGVAGSGKSHAAHEEGRQYLQEYDINEDVYDLMLPDTKNDKLWWQGYTGQSVVVMDDFAGTIDPHTFKRLVDRWPMTVEKKNGSTAFLAKRIYITSNHKWSSWWGTSTFAHINDREAFERRITVEKEFTVKYIKPVADPMMATGSMFRDDSLTSILGNARIIDAGYVGELSCDEDQAFLESERIARESMESALAYNDLDEYF